MNKPNTFARAPFARWGRLAVAALAVAAMVTPLAACEGQLPTPVADSSTQATPDLTEAQEKKIRLAILDGIDAADQAKSVDQLAAVMGGPQLEIRSSQITVAQKTGSLSKFAVIPKDVAQVVIPTDDGWPRSVFTITTTTSDQQSKRLLVMNQASARQNYKLVAMARLFEGAQLPKFEIPTLGSKQGSAKDSGLVMTAANALTQYADVLQNGSNSQYASKFADDLLRQNLAKTAADVQAGMERNNGTQQQTFEAVPDQMWVMRSAEGGELVVGRINSVWVRKAGDGRESQPASDDEKALYNSDKYTSTMQVTYVNVVALYIPKAGGADAQVTAVGADRQPVKVEAL